MSGLIGFVMKDPEVVFVESMIARFRDRAEAVRKRTLPPVAGAERRLFVKQAELDFQDFAILADAEGCIDDGVLCLRVDLSGREA